MLGQPKAVRATPPVHRDSKVTRDRDPAAHGHKTRTFQPPPRWPHESLRHGSALHGPKGPNGEGMTIVTMAAVAGPGSKPRQGLTEDTRTPADVGAGQTDPELRAGLHRHSPSQQDVRAGTAPKDLGLETRFPATKTSPQAGHPRPRSFHTSSEPASPKPCEQEGSSIPRRDP